MKSLKKTLVLLVVFSMILSTLVPAFAATDVIGLDCEDQVTRMEALGIIEGFEDGTFRPDETITRAQMAVVICKMVGINEAAANANANVSSKFSDVAAGEWYTGWVNLASNNGIISGYPDGTFRPNQTLTLNEVLTLCVKALGRGGYVDKMGTWPANYVTEAARLNLLKDVKGASDANRGTVAIIGWNTLNADTWYVTGENLDGEVSLGSNGGKETKNLLAINFNEYTIGETNALKEQEIEATDDVKVKDRQLLINTAALDADGLLAEFETKVPKKNKEEKSFIDGSYAYIYVPEEVYGDLDSLKNKKLTIILGEDEIAALIILEDDVLETAFLTKYDVEDNKITVDGETYKLALDSNDDVEYKVEINGALQTGKSLEEALKLIDPNMDLKDIEKKIEATLTLNGDDKVELIELFVSDTVANTAEVLVTKVKETSKKYTITTTGKELSWEIENEEEKDFSFPTIYIDGVKGDIRDIEAGNVLTIITDNSSDNSITYKMKKDDKDIDVAIAKIYVSTNTVTGEATRVKKANDAITVDGEVYTKTAEVIKVTEKELKDNVFADLNKDTFSKNVLDSDEVTLYLNIYGEYVAVSLADAESDYTFGVVTYISNSITWDGEDEEIAVRNFKVLLPDGTKKTFKITVNVDDNDIENSVKSAVQAELSEFKMFKENTFVMFETDYDNVIEIEKGTEVKTLDKDSKVEIGDDYILAGYDKLSAVNKDAKEFTATVEITGANNPTVIEAEYDADETVIFNTYEKEIVTKWSSILAADGKAFADTDTFVIFADKDDEVPAYIVVDIEDKLYTSSDAQYAVVEKSAYHEDDKYYVDLYDEGTVEVDDEIWAELDENTVNAFIEYEMKSSKVSQAVALFDIEDVAELDADDNIPANMFNRGFETIPVVNFGELSLDITANKAADTKDWGLTGNPECVTYRLVGFLPAGEDVTVKITNPVYQFSTDNRVQEKDGNYYIETTTDRTNISNLVVLLLKGSTEPVTCEVSIAGVPFKSVVINPTVTIDADKAEAVVAKYEAVKDNLTVEKTKEYDDYIKLYYKEFEESDYAIEDLGSVNLDKETIVYDVRGGEGIKTLTFSEFRAIDFANEDILVVPYRNADCDTDPNVEANILVIID